MVRFSFRRLLPLAIGLAFVFTLLALVAKEEEASLIASRKKCKHTIQSLAIALHWYLAANKSFPAATWSNPDLEPENRLSWFALILPQLDRRNLYDAVDSAKPWNVGQNDVVAHTHLPIASCPNLSTPEPGSSQPASFVGIAGLGTDAPALPKSDARAGVFGCDRKTTLADITDGPANTMLLAETARVSGSWLQGGPATVRGLDPAAKPYVRRRSPIRWNPRRGCLGGDGRRLGSLGRTLDRSQGTRGVVNDGRRRAAARGLVKTCMVRYLRTGPRLRSNSGIVCNGNPSEE